MTTAGRRGTTADLIRWLFPQNSALRRLTRERFVRVGRRRAAHPCPHREASTAARSAPLPLWTPNNDRYYLTQNAPARLQWKLSVEHVYSIHLPRQSSKGLTLASHLAWSGIQYQGSRLLPVWRNASNRKNQRRRLRKDHLMTPQTWEKGFIISGTIGIGSTA